MLQLNDSFCIESLAKSKLGGTHEGWEFGIVKNMEDLEGVRLLRLKLYHGKRKYLESLVDKQGSDAYDGHSYLFFAKHMQRYVASVRMTKYPFETTKYLSESDLHEFLGDGYQQAYLEVGRLVADCEDGCSTLSFAMLTYAISMAASSTDCSKYLAYSNPKLKQTAFKYHQHADVRNFKIPERRQSNYVLFKGDLKQEYSALLSN